MFPNQPNNTQKVSSSNNLYNIFFYYNNQGPNNPRYKTTLCKHYNTPQGCSYGDKCQFAHGQNELRLNNAQGFAQMPMNNMNNKQNSMLNYKIVKCKNFEKDGSCKYGAHCTFAHGDKDLRNKSENLYQINNSQMMMMMPFPPYGMEGFQVMMPPPGVDMSQMQQMVAPGAMGQNPPYMMMMQPQNNDNMNNANNENAEQKAENTQQ